MNRGDIKVSIDAIKKILHLPDDFKVSGVVYDCQVDSLHIYGYSKEFKPVVECGIPVPTVLTESSKKPTTSEEATIHIENLETRIAQQGSRIKELEDIADPTHAQYHRDSKNSLESVVVAIGSTLYDFVFPSKDDIDYGEIGGPHRGW